MNPFAAGWRDKWLYLTAIVASILLSCWINARETIINPDAICYLLTAEEIGKSGISHALHVCGQALAWPFYSSFIYVIAQVTHLSYLNAAYVLDALLSAISVVTFIAIIKELGGSRLVLWFAALVILLSHEFNSVRQYIIRDHGFWAFYLLSVLCCLRYLERPRWLYALAWNGSLLMAMIFRIEASIFLLLMPFCVWLRAGDTLKQRGLHFLQLNIAAIFVAAAIIGWWWLHPGESLMAFGRIYTLIDEWQYWLTRTAARYYHAKMSLAASVLPPESSREAGLVFSVTAIVWYLLSIVNNVSWAYAGLFLYAIYSRSVSLTRSAAMVLGGYLMVNFLITFGFFAENLFLSSRYLMALSLVLMFWVPFGMMSLWQQFAGGRQRYVFTLVMLAVIYSALGGIFDFGYSKAYMREAAVWLAAYVPEEAELYINNRQILYYSGLNRQDFFKTLKRHNEQNKIAARWWTQYDYVALRLTRDEPDPLAVAENGQYKPKQVFKNKRGDRVVIYQIPHNLNKRQLF